MPNDEALEKAEAFIRRHSGGDRSRVFRDKVARYEEGKLTLAPADDRYREGGAVSQYEDTAPPRVRRSRTERLDAMIKHLVNLPPEVLEAKIQEVQGEFWRLGMPVAYEDLKAVAARYLNMRGTDNNYTPEVTRK